jgi:hypothetical protein
MIAPGGNLSVVFQLPTESGQTVGASQFSSILNLKSHFSVVNPKWLRKLLAERGFRLIQQTTRALPASKGFWMGIFSAPKGHPTGDENTALYLNLKLVQDLPNFKPADDPGFTNLPYNLIFSL